MSRNNDPMPWTVEMNQHLTDYVLEGYHDLKAAAKHREAVLRVHQDGWTAVAKAIAAGLADIANAIRYTRDGVEPRRR